MAEAGIAYEHFAGLGGLRHPKKDSPNGGWRNEGFRGYADYMLTPEFAENVERLIEKTGEKRVAVMCAEAVPWRCHRSLLADALSVRGIAVAHIMNETTANDHKLTPFAKVSGTLITYPPDTLGLKFDSDGTRERYHSIGIMTDTPQFGEKPDQPCKERPCAYAVIFDDRQQLLAVKVGDIYHLPGGGVDEDEDPITAVIRETREETGYEITDLGHIGNANQYFVKTEKGPINKMGIFYRARTGSLDPSAAEEPDHEPCWLTPEEFLKSSASDFQKWAVRKSIE